MVAGPGKMYAKKMLPRWLLITLKREKRTSGVLLNGQVVKSLNASAVMPNDGVTYVSQAMLPFSCALLTKMKIFRVSVPKCCCKD